MLFLWFKAFRSCNLFGKSVFILIIFGDTLLDFPIENATFASIFYQY